MNYNKALINATREPDQLITVLQITVPYFMYMFHQKQMSHSMRFPTIWHFDKCRLRWAYAASF